MDYKDIIDRLKFLKDFLEDQEMYSSKSMYISILHKYCILELKYLKEVKEANKEILKYLKLCPPPRGMNPDLEDWFLYMYSRFNPVRFAVETFDSIEVIRKELSR